MKGFVLLAVLMLVPSMGYFQKLHFEGSLQEKMVKEVRADLEAGGARDVEVGMNWLDVTMAGVVSSEALRADLTEKVRARPGLRVAAAGNRLKVQGWLRVERKGAQWTADGLLPNTFMLADRKGGAEKWDAGVRRDEWVEAPVGVRKWGEFLAEYFEAPGDRSVELRDGRLEIAGEATLGLRADWLSMASGLVPKEAVSGSFSIHPSISHFVGYVPAGVEDMAGMRELRVKLAATVVEFEPDSAEVSGTETAKVAAVAATILEVTEKVVFLLEGSPGGESLGRRRAEEVEQLLLGYGVRQDQLETMEVDAGGAGAAAHRVRILLK